MNTFGLSFHHFGLAVRSPEPAFAFLAALGYTGAPALFDPLQGVNLAMRRHTEMPDVEVIWPGAAPSPIDGILKRSDGMIYHLCYTAPDPAASLAKMADEGLEILPATEPKAAILFGGQQVSFYFIGGFGLVELLHGEHATAASHQD